MIRPIFVMALAVGLAGQSSGQSGQAADPPGFHFWSHADLESAENGLAPQMDAHNFKSNTLASAGNHRYLVVHREGPGQVEYHATEADIAFIQSGTATLVYGGTIVGGKPTGPNEVRGDSITGGMERKVAAGDVITIPAKLPHWMKPDPGKKFNYFVVKITE